MVRANSDQVSLWELAVLSLLREEPMHPYQMQRLLRERHKDDVLALKRGSLYHAIARLSRAGRIESVATERDGRRPERTTYRLTPTGKADHVRWLRARIAAPADEPSEFVASLNFLVYLTPKDALTQLEARAGILAQRVEALTAVVAQLATFLDRINYVESEYSIAAQKAELAWVRGLIEDLRSGRLTWNLEKILDGARAARRTAERGKSHAR